MIVERAYQRDITEHDLAGHPFRPPSSKSPEWYAMFGNACTECRQPAKFETEVVKETVPDETPKQKISAKARIKSKKESK